MPIKRSEFKKFANSQYQEFESTGVTAREAVAVIETRIHRTEAELSKLRVLRNDMSTRLCPITEPFNRAKHTHRFGNL